MMGRGRLGVRQIFLADEIEQVSFASDPKSRFAPITALPAQPRRPILNHHHRPVLRRTFRLIHQKPPSVAR